ncbi:hypothetical protein B0J13DRAFT_554173 [Dactylonectria estremocensis]|uniref:Uncharacterized protein n=1 Tax=Dactylonectria estremocensis TaxID=1079267 RepID=A0A9P9EUD8_9HYPO|nr:hypothetical protein B0J13DRAFT_554173 [Dactylonectria estremocensis]
MACLRLMGRFLLRCSVLVLGPRRGFRRLGSGLDEPLSAGERDGSRMMDMWMYGWRRGAPWACRGGGGSNWQVSCVRTHQDAFKQHRRCHRRLCWQLAC